MVAGLVMAVFGVFLWIGLALGTGFKGLEPLIAIQRQLNALPGVQSTQVTENWSSGNKQGREHTLNIIVRLAPNAHERRRAIALAAVARALDVWKFGQTDAIGVQVAEGYDIGIAEKWWSEGERHTAAEWFEVLRKAGVNAGDVKT
jgi:hypothetical protein